MTKFILVVAIVAFCTVPCDAAKQVLLIAGEPSHAEGEHEFVEATELLAECLNETELDIEAVAIQGFPDADILETADTVFLYSDGLDKHGAKEHLQSLRDHVAKGRGLGVMHFALEPSNSEMADFFDETLGGHFAAGYSVNPIWELQDPLIDDHPIGRGVSLNEIEDEWYFHIHFANKVEPVLQAHPPMDTLGADGPRSGNPQVRAALRKNEPQTLAWSRTTENDARTFGFTGGHYLFNWSEDGYRKLILNAIVWTAGVEVPEKGVVSSITPIPRYPSIDQAIARGKMRDVKRHIAADPDKLQQGKNSQLTPLHQAILRRQAEIALFLIEEGADVDRKDGSQRTPLHMAVERDMPEVIAALLETGADPDKLDRSGWSPLHHAAAKKRLDALEALLQGGADPMCLSERGGTALHEAAASGSVQIAQALLDAGADPNVVSKNGVTALDIAKEYENEDVREILQPITDKREGDGK